MANLYGIVKIDVSPAITDADVQYLRDTDLGLSMGTSTTASTSVTQKGEAATLSARVAGSGYTVGSKKVLVQSGSTGSGTGLKVMADIVPGSRSIRTSVVNGKEHTMTLTANFDSFQSGLYLLGGSFPLGFVLDGGIPFSGVSTAVDGSGTSGGTGAKFFVTATNGMISKIVPDPSNLGSDYVVGDIITIARGDYVAANTFSGAVSCGGDIQMLVTENDITGGIADVSTVTIINGGSGHAAADVITLTEEGSDSVGSGTVTIGTVGGSTSTQGPNVTYPTGVYITSATAKDVQIKDTMGNDQVLGAMQPGVIRPITFSQIMGAGTTAAVGEVTIVYGDH